MKITYSKKMKFMGIFNVVHDNLSRIQFFFLCFMASCLFCAMYPGQNHGVEKTTILRLKTATSNDLMRFDCHIRSQICRKDKEEGVKSENLMSNRYLKLSQ